MREYAKFGPTFWTGETGKALRKKGPKALLVAAYLISSPHSNMLGLYYQPILYMAHETGLGIEGASEGLQDCIECGFCAYDHDTEMAWVYEMAAWQISDALSSGDKRCKGIQKDYEGLPPNPFLAAWFDKYRLAFHLAKRRSNEGGKPEVDEGPPQAPSKPHRSQEQEQEQEEERDSAGAIEPTLAGKVCLALKRSGIPDVNPAHPKLLALLGAGASEAEFVNVAPKAKGKANGFAYVLTIVENDRRAAADMANGLHHGPMPKAQTAADSALEAMFERGSR